MKYSFIVLLIIVLAISCSDPEKKKIEEYNSQLNLEVEVCKL
jgi:hypothetical protein